MQFTWYKEWENLQKLGETEYRLYLVNCHEKGLEFEFLQIDMDGFARFKWVWQVFLFTNILLKIGSKKIPKLVLKSPKAKPKHNRPLALNIF